LTPPCITMSFMTRAPGSAIDASLFEAAPEQR
jgi:hypothetical protein